MSTDRSPREMLGIRVRQRHRERYWEGRDPREHECEGCGRGYNVVGNRWEVHHRDGDWLNGHPMNLVGICRRCHYLIHKSQNRQRALESWKGEIEAMGGA